MTQMLEPVSLGYACDVKYQASRNLFFRLTPQGAEREFRDLLFRQHSRVSPFRRHIFDWMIIPFEAMCAYLGRDFVGVLERGDLVAGKAGTTVMHRDLLTYHPHDFKGGAEGQITDAMIDVQYPAFRSKYEFLAQRFRDLLQTPGPYLYIYREIVTQASAQRLADLLRARSPDHRFELLFVDTRGAVNQVLSRVDVPTHKGWLAPGGEKAGDRAWEGSDSAWDTVLNRFDLGLHGVHRPVAAAPVAPPAAAPAVAPAGAPPSRGWRRVLSADGPEQLLTVFSHVDARTGAERRLVEADGVSFQEPLPEDHMFCQFQPVALGRSGGWARLTLDWAPDAVRAGLAVQDQECRHPPVASTVSSRSDGADREVMILTLASDVDHLRLVATPAGEGRSMLPVRAVVEVVPAAAPERALWARLTGRAAGPRQGA